MPLDNFYRQIVALEEFDVVKETIDIINKNSYFIIALLRGQLQRGKDGKGEDVLLDGRNFYKDSTVFEKERHGVGLGKQTEFITNYMGGTFYNTLKVITKGETFETIGTVPYFQDILRRSGSIIMELDKQSLEEFKEEILIPQLQERFNSKMNS